MYTTYDGARRIRIEHRGDRDASAVVGTTFSGLTRQPCIYEKWKTLVLAHKVRGVNVHDARLVAAMMIHGVTHILTANVNDFQRYPDITVLAPEEIE